MNGRATAGSVVRPRWPVGSPRTRQPSPRLQAVLQRRLVPSAPRPSFPERMFPDLRDRTREAVGRAVDRALELATLGEYRYVPDDRAVAAVAVRRRPRVRPAPDRRPAPGPSSTMLPRRLGAATPAGRLAASAGPSPSRKLRTPPPSRQPRTSCACPLRAFASGAARYLRRRRSARCRSPIGSGPRRYGRGQPTRPRSRRSSRNQRIGCWSLASLEASISTKRRKRAWSGMRSSMRSRRAS